MSTTSAERTRLESWWRVLGAVSAALLLVGVAVTIAVPPGTVAYLLYAVGVVAGIAALIGLIRHRDRLEEG